MPKTTQAPTWGEEEGAQDSRGHSSRLHSPSASPTYTNIFRPHSFATPCQLPYSVLYMLGGSRSVETSVSAHMAVPRLPSLSKLESLTPSVCVLISAFSLWNAAGPYLYRPSLWLVDPYCTESGAGGVQMTAAANSWRHLGLRSRKLALALCLLQLHLNLLLLRLYPDRVRR